MDFRVLGPLEVSDGGRLVPLPRGRGRALMALLVLRAGRVVAAERLIDDLWGESPPATATTALQNLVSGLRHRLEPTRASGQDATVIETRSPGYLLAVEPMQVDATRFRALLETVSGSPAAERAARLREALALWRGSPLADFAYEPFAQGEISTLEELRLAAVEARIDADLELGRHTDLTGELHGLVAQHPLRERLRGQLMTALYRSGRQVEALDVFRDARLQLVEELGIEPGQALQRLERAILDQDASLSVPAGGYVDLLPAAEAEPWLTRERKTVTIVLLRMTAPAGADQELDPEALALVVDRFVDQSAEVLTRHGGRVEPFIGGEVYSVFGVPTAHEDDALRAVRAAVELRQAIVVLNEELERDRGFRLLARVAVSTGEAVVDDPASAQRVAAGEAVGVAGRLLGAATDGAALVDGATQRLTRDLVRVEPAHPGDDPAPGPAMLAWRLLGLAHEESGAVHQHDAPMVGRDTELTRLTAAFEHSVARGSAHRCTVLGEPGVGKSRLARELADSIGPDARVLTGHCPSYGDGITFWPLREIVDQATGPGGAEVLAELLRADEMFPATRRFLEDLARRGPLVVVVEDVHWAEPTLLELLDYLADHVDAPLLLLCLARPELLELRPEWKAGGPRSDCLFLEPLGSADIERLVAGRLAGAPLPPETLTRVVDSAQGNPLFAEQMVAAFEEDGIAAVPASVQALLAARLDRLGPAERDLLRSAAVVGQEFSVDALTGLIPDQARPFVERHLATLQDKHLVRRTSSREQTFRFRHVLVQVAAYRSITRVDRARLHQRFANWLEFEAEHPPPELDEVLGYHLERTVAQRRALGMPGRHDASLGTRAGEHLAAAGARAFRRRDTAGAENLLSRARTLLGPDHPKRSEVIRLLADVYPPLGRHDEADAVLVEMLDQAVAAGDRPLERALGLKRARIRLDTGADPADVYAIREEGERVLRVATGADDHRGVAQAAYLLAQVYRLLGATREMESVARVGLSHADRSGLVREEPSLRYAVAWAVAAGESPVPEALDVCEELAGEGDTLHSPVLCELAVLRAMVGDVGEARELITRARRQMVERLRVRRPLMFAGHASAAVERLAGDVAAAEGQLRTALEMAVEMGERDQLSQIAAQLSLNLSAGSRTEEAARLATMSAEHASAEGVSHSLWHAAQARVLLHRGAHLEARRLVGEAVRLAPVTMLSFRADRLVDLAEVVCAGGDDQDRAMPAIDEAVALYERKGNLVSADRARLVRGTIEG